MANTNERKSPPSRPEALQRLAAQLGMQYQLKDEWGLIKQLGDFRLFQRGMGRRITNLMSSKDDMLETTFHLFDYQFKVSTGKTTKVFNQSVFFVDSRKLGLPQFTMKPENFLHFIGDLLGFKDIDFEEFPKFSNNYYLKGEDEAFIRSSLPHQFLYFFSEEKGWYLEAINYYLIFYRTNHLMGPRALKGFYTKGVNIFQMLK